MPRPFCPKNFGFLWYIINIIFLSFQISTSIQFTVNPDQTAPNEKSDLGQDLHYLLFHLHVLEDLATVLSICSNFNRVTAIFSVSENVGLKDLNSTVAKRGSVFIGLMTPDGSICFRYQRLRRSKYPYLVKIHLLDLNGQTCFVYDNIADKPLSE